MINGLSFIYLHIIPNEYRKKVWFILNVQWQRVFALTIETDQQDNVKNGAVNIIDEMRNMMEKEMS